MGETRPTLVIQNYCDMEDALSKGCDAILPLSQYDGAAEDLLVIDSVVNYMCDLSAFCIAGVNQSQNVEPVTQIACWEDCGAEEHVYLKADLLAEAARAVAIEAYCTFLYDGPRSHKEWKESADRAVSTDGFVDALDTVLARVLFQMIQQSGWFLFQDLDQGSPQFLCKDCGGALCGSTSRPWEKSEVSAQ
jgi:hypothetical protein